MGCAAARQTAACTRPGMLFPAKPGAGPGLRGRACVPSQQRGLQAGPNHAHRPGLVLLPPVRCRKVAPGKASSSAEYARALSLILGEAPAYSPSDTCPLDYVQQLLRWGAPAAASLAGCFVPSEADSSAGVDIAALHAAGCFPHAWPLPLTAAGVQAANREAAVAYAADPEGTVQAVLDQGIYFNRGRGKHRSCTSGATERSRARGAGRVPSPSKERSPAAKAAAPPARSYPQTWQEQVVLTEHRLAAAAAGR